MVLSGLSKPIDWFIDVAPAPLKIVIFLFILLVFGSIVSNLFIENNYYCQEGRLIDNTEFSKCISLYMNGYMYKQNMSRDYCYTLPQAQDPYWNETVCGEVVPKMNDATILLYIGNAITAPSRRTLDWLIGNKNLTRGALLNYVFDPSKAICTDLYDCLEIDTRSRLNLTPNCNIIKGDDYSDDYPTLEEYTFYTRQNKTISEDSIDEFKIFGIKCVQLGDKDDTTPEFTFLGIPLLDWRIWIIMLMFGAMLWLIVNLRKA